MARLSDEFVDAVRDARGEIYGFCRKAGISYGYFCQFMPRRRWFRYGFPLGSAPKSVPRARSSKTRLGILEIAKGLGVPADRVFIEDERRPDPSAKARMWRARDV